MIEKEIRTTVADLKLEYRKGKMDPEDEETKAHDPEEMPDEDEMPEISGHAARFNTLSEDLGGFREMIQPGAFKNALEDPGLDVRALVDHEPSRILGRTKAGTLEIAEDKEGLRVKITPPNTSVARDLIESIKRGDIDQMSFGFILAEEDGDEWTFPETGPAMRIIKNIGRLFDVSAVTYPAYPATDIAVAQRRLEHAKATPKRDMYRAKFATKKD